MTRGFYTILCAQFLSSLADNALLIASIALLASLQAPEWMTPLLKLFFVLSYVGLAAWVGIFADSMPKGRVMFITNAIKVTGCLLMLFGSHPLLAYAIVGVGAAAYSPAKYGILTELLPPEKLVVANGWMEGLTVISIILGTVLGGVLIRPDVAGFLIDSPLSAIGVSTEPAAALTVIAIVYALAALANAFIPDTGARYPKQRFQPLANIAGFAKSCKILWTDSLGQISLTVTSLFWGAGATLQFIIIKWADMALGMNLSEAAILQAVISIGIAIGAVLAAALVPLKKSVSVLPMGVVMGVVAAAMAFFRGDMLPAGGIPLGFFTLTWPVLVTCIALVIVGIAAGYFVVPMNALLQHRGHVLMSAGRSIAVQNFNENGSILIMLAVYSGMITLGLSTQTIMLGFGAAIAIAMLLVMRWHKANQRRCDTMHLIGEDVRADRHV